jgi:hypothetical protein
MDLIGHVYGRLTVLRLSDRRQGKNKYWHCVCECGVSREVGQGHLRGGHTQSCGCKNIERMRSRNGASNTGEYRSWRSMVSRCTDSDNVSYANYGAKGVRVCNEWLFDFDYFLKCVGPKPTPTHSLDRIDNKKGYEPGNVRWATKLEQTLNREVTVMVEYLGVLQPLAILARAVGLCPMTAHNRVVKNGWSVERALTTPVAQRTPVSAPLGLSTAP